ncbi:MAG: Flp pilus assembly complex ATPase component TadA, partial [Chloroflexi bacterium]|nr:Flp pilus assembly complex ATPase component TadA [Chloroflexota bacterium]
LVEAGETAGDLDRAAFCLADYFELASRGSGAADGGSGAADGGSGAADGPAGFPTAGPLQVEPKATEDEPSARGAEGSENESGEPATPIGGDLLAALIEAPLAEGSSDLHLQPGPMGLRVRARTGGILRTLTDLQPPESQRLISQLNILADLNLADKRSPQEGMINLQINHRPHRIRINTFPFADGESVHLQVVETQQAPEGLMDRGMTVDQRTECLRLLSRPHGIVAVAGRAGSPVTRTLYAMLHELESEGVLRSACAAAIEDPVEADLPAVMQVQLNRAAGLNASQALRSVLHQDTDIIMIGRVADPTLMAESARAAASGYMVLIGVDAEDAASGLEWLLRLESDVAPDQILGVVAQRSLRIACPSCRGQGCDSCAGIGYTGSTFAFEVLAADGAEMQRLMHRGASRDEFAAAAERAGMMTLAASAAARVEPPWEGEACRVANPMVENNLTPVPLSETARGA